MKTEELLKSTLEKTELPVKEYEYIGTKPEYIVFNEEVEKAITHGDNYPEEMEIWWQVHIFSPKTSDFRERKRAVRKLLLNAGFVIGDIETLYEKETKTIHIVITCGIEESEE